MLPGKVDSPERSACDLSREGEHHGPVTVPGVPFGALEVVGFGGLAEVVIQGNRPRLAPPPLRTPSTAWGKSCFLATSRAAMSAPVCPPDTSFSIMGVSVG